MTEIRLEVPAENSVLEVLYDGRELYQQPPTMSESLTQLARKVDFGSSEGEDLANEDKEEEEEKPFQQPHWPFEEIRNKIRSGYTEVCVLHDLLQITKENRHMVLEPVQATELEPKLYVQFLSLKESFSNAANTLLLGAKRLQSSQSDLCRTRQMQDFHMELLNLRQNWRLKKIGNNIFGDFTYRNESTLPFKHAGYFEVSKADTISAGVNYGACQGMNSPLASQSNRLMSSLNVTVPPELEGSAYIFVCISKDEEELCSVQIPAQPVLSKETVWQKRLEYAQNVLLCKELFSHLAREAVILKPPIPYLVVGNQITATIFPGIHLIIALSHTESEKSNSTACQNGFASGMLNTSCGGGGNLYGPFRKIHDWVLEHTLHQLFHHNFLLANHQSMPQPAYASLGIPKKRRLAGPDGTELAQLVQLTKSETMLEQIVKQAQHNFLRLRTMYMIDTLAIEFKDPLIISHWSIFNSSNQSVAKINIITQGYDSVYRTSLVLHVYEKSLKCICRDGKVMTMSYEPQELRNLILCQISQHNMAAVQSFAKYVGWTVISSEDNLGVGQTESLGNASSVMLASPMGNKVLVVRTAPFSTMQPYVAVSSSPRNDFYTSSVVSERKWEHLGGSWQEVRLDRIEGKNFLNKIELLMAALTAQS